MLYLLSFEQQTYGLQPPASWAGHYNSSYPAEGASKEQSLRVCYPLGVASRQMKGRKTAPNPETPSGCYSYFLGLSNTAGHRLHYPLLPSTTLAPKSHGATPATAQRPDPALHQHRSSNWLSWKAVPFLSTLQTGLCEATLCSCVLKQLLWYGGTKLFVSPFLGESLNMEIF